MPDTATNNFRAKRIARNHKVGVSVDVCPPHYFILVRKFIPLDQLESHLTSDYKVIRDTKWGAVVEKQMLMTSDTVQFIYEIFVWNEVIPKEATIKQFHVAVTPLDENGEEILESRRAEYNL